MVYEDEGDGPTLIHEHTLTKRVVHRDARVKLMEYGFTKDEAKNIISENAKKLRAFNLGIEEYQRLMLLDISMLKESTTPKEVDALVAKSAAYGIDLTNPKVAA